MEAFGAVGVLLVGVVLVVLAVLALFVPYFIYAINKNVQLIQQDVHRLLIREDAKPTIR